MVMDFPSKWRVFACVSLMVMFGLLANAKSEPILNKLPSADAVHSDSNCCSAARLTSIERRLNDIEGTVATVNDPPLIEYCVVDLASWGLDDSPIRGYVKTSAGSSDETRDASRYRGVTLFTLDPTTCRTKNGQRFDTYESAEDREQLLETIESAAADTIIVGVTADAAESFVTAEFQTSAGKLFTRYNMNLTGLQPREKFAFILQKGYPKKTVFERKPRYGESLQLKVALRGTTVSDVTFKRL